MSRLNSRTCGVWLALYGRGGAERAAWAASTCSSVRILKKPGFTDIFDLAKMKYRAPLVVTRVDNSEVTSELLRPQPVNKSNGRQCDEFTPKENKPKKERCEGSEQNALEPINQC